MKPINTKRSEEVSDIIERMPMTFGRWVAGSVALFTVLILIAGWCIKYPDTVTGQITINSNLAPIKLIAGTSGKIHLCNITPQDSVKEGEYIAIIQNSADAEDMKTVIDAMQRFSFHEDSLLSEENLFPTSVSLGELNLKYYTFISALKNMCNYQKENLFEQQRINLTNYIQWEHQLLHQTEEELKTSNEKLTISQKWFQRNTALQKKDVIPEFELDQIKNQYLSALYNSQDLEKGITNIRIQLTEAENKLKQLEIEQHEKENQMHLDLVSTFQELTDATKIWEQNYVFKAPFDGRVEFLKFWTENQFAEAGEAVFSIVPQQTDIMGQMLLPVNGAGKVKAGCGVIIKLDNYPYMEFGSVDGQVCSISLVSQPLKTGQNSIDTYLITVDLSNGLVTNYGKELDFKYEIKGTADIIIKKRRLIERLFDNLKYYTQ